MKSRQVRSVSNYGANFIFLMLCFLGTGTGSVWILVKYGVAVQHGDYLVVCMLLACFALLSCRAIMEWDRLKIDNGKLEIRSLLGYVKKEIYLDEITDWTELYKKNRGISWTELTIFTGRTKYKITSTYYNNYSTLKSVLAKPQLHDVQAEKRWERRNGLYFSVGFGVMGLLFLTGGILLYHSREKLVLREQVCTIKGEISNMPEISRISGGTMHLDIRLSSYPRHIFRIGGRTFNATQVQTFVKHVKAGDVVFVAIDKKACQEEITDQQSSVGNVPVEKQLIPVLELSDGEYNYLSLADYNAGKKPEILWILCVFSSIACLIAAVFVAYSKKMDPSWLPRY